MGQEPVQSFRARFLWVEPGRIYAPGELRVSGGRVVGVGPLSRGSSRRGRVPARAILPGLVNAHVHLQIPALRQQRRAFLPWVNQVIRERAQSSDADHVARAAEGLSILLRDGVTAVGEIDSTGHSPTVLRDVPVGGVCYQELLGFHLGRRSARELVAARTRAGSRHCRSGLSPHAPYSVSAELFRAAGARGVPLAIHVAETPEEVRFLRSGTGPFRELLEKLGRLPPDFRAPGVGAVTYLDRLGLLSPLTMLVHGQHLAESEVRLIAERAAPLVVCPGTIRYFRRDPPPVRRWLDRGIRVGLGTDSRASNAELSMRHEMGLLRNMCPALSPEEVLAMATMHGGGALHRASLGTLRRGAPASFVSVPTTSDLASCLEPFTCGTLAPDGVWLRGRRVSLSRRRRSG